MVGAMVTVYVLAFARVLPVVVLHPVFGGRTAPRVALVTLSAILASAFVPALGQVPRDMSGWSLLTAFIAEIALGSAIGILGQAVFGVIEAAGRLVDDVRGASLAQLFSPHTQAATSPIGQLDVVAALALFWAGGFHIPFVMAMADTFVTIPVGSSGMGTGESGTQPLNGLLSWAGVLSNAGLAIAGPAAIACLLVDLLFGVVNKSAPQASVFPLALPVKLLAAVAVTGLTMVHRAEIWSQLFVRQTEWLGR